MWCVCAAPRVRITNALFCPCECFVSAYVFFPDTCVGEGVYRVEQWDRIESAPHRHYRHYRQVALYTGHTRHRTQDTHKRSHVATPM